MGSRDSKNGGHGKTSAAETRRDGGVEGEQGERSISGRSANVTPAATGAPHGGVTGESSYLIMNNVFRVDSRYSGLKPIGKGSFGFVCSALDEKQGQRVAIKKIHPMAQHVDDAKHVLREIRLMRFLGSHPNIVSLEDLFVSEHYDDLYIVMELLDSDLHRIIQSPQALSDAHHRYFMFQLLEGVKFLHHNRIIHRDLKPGNVLVTKKCELRITDFGLARLRPMGRGNHPDDEVEHPMTEHVVTRWYRPPELMLCPDGLYGYAVDLWSVGCIFAELLGRHPLFPGKNFMDQLTLIFNLVGSPQPHEVAHIRNSQARRFLDSMQDRVKKPYVDLFAGASEHAIDLLEGLLVFDPPGRLSVDEALDHPYFQPLRKNDAKPDPEVPPGFEFDFESEPLCRVQLKQMILEEVESFQRAQRKRDKRARASAAANDSATSSTGSNSSSTSNRDGPGGDGLGTGSGDSNNRYLPDVKHAEGNGSAAAGAATAAGNGDRLQEQQQWHGKPRRQADEGAPPATGVGTTSKHRGGDQEGGGGGWTGGRESEKERAPISAVRSSAQASSEASTIRAGLGSFRSVSQHSNWGAGSSVRTEAHVPQGQYHVPQGQYHGHETSSNSDNGLEYAPFNGGAGRGGAGGGPGTVPGAVGHSSDGVAEPTDDEMEDWESSSSAARRAILGHYDARRSPDHTAPTPMYQGRFSGYVGAGSGQQQNGHMGLIRPGQDAERGNIALHDRRWRGGGGGGGKFIAGRQPGITGETLQSPVRIRRSTVPTAAASSAMTTGPKRLDKGDSHGQQHRGQQKQQQHHRRGGNRGGGTKWGLGSRYHPSQGGAPAPAPANAALGMSGKGGHYPIQHQHQHEYHHQHSEQYYPQDHHPPQHQHQQQQPPQQGGDLWCTKSTGLRDVEDRFHQLHFDRTRIRGGERRSEDDLMQDPTVGMRAPKR